MRREPLRPICSKIRRRPSGVPGSLPSTSILTPHRLRSTVYVAPFVFQSTSMPVPSFSPHSLPGQRKKAGPGTRLRASERLLRSWGRRAPRPAAPSAQRLCPTVSCTSLWGSQVLGPRHARSQVPSGRRPRFLFPPPLALGARCRVHSTRRIRRVAFWHRPARPSARGTTGS